MDFSLTWRERFFSTRSTNVCRVSWETASKKKTFLRGFNELSSVTLSNAIYRFIMTAVATYNVMTSFCELIRNLRLCLKMTGCFFFGEFNFAANFSFFVRKKYLSNFSLRRLVSGQFLRRVFPPKIYFLLCSFSHLRLLGKFSFVTGFLLPSSLFFNEKRFIKFSGT